MHFSDSESNKLNYCVDADILQIAGITFESEDEKDGSGKDLSDDELVKIDVDDSDTHTIAEALMGLDSIENEEEKIE